MKTTITEHERLALIGLFTLANRHVKMLTQIQHAAADVLGLAIEDGSSPENPYYGHLSDAIYDDYRRDVDAVLVRLGITVTAAADATPAESTK